MANPASIRLGTTGKAQVKADLTEIGATGTASFKTIGDASEAQAKRWARSYESAGRDVEAAMQRQKNASSKLDILMPGLNPTKLDAAAGVRDTVGKDAAASASIFTAAYAQMERRANALVAAIDPVFAAQQRFDAEMSQAKVLFDAGVLSAERYEQVQRKITLALNDQQQAAVARDAAVQRASTNTLEGAAGVRTGGFKSAADSASVFAEAQQRLEMRTRALISAIDPAFAAQQRFDMEMREARELVTAGELSLDRYVQKLGVEQRALDQATQAHKRATVSTGQFRAGTQQLSYQISDVSASLGSGTSLTQVFAQQVGQTVQAVQLMTGATSGLVGWLAGPWGAAVTGGVILLTMLAAKYMDNKDAAEKAESAMKKFQDRQSDIGKFIDETTGKLKEQNLTLIRNAALTRAARIDENNKAIKEGSQNAFVKARDVLGSTTPIYTAGGVISPKIDPALRKAIESAGSDVVKLDANLQALGRKRPDLKTVINDISNLAGQAVVASQENKRLALEVRALNGDTTALAKADTSLIDARAKLAGATNNMDRAQARYTISIREADNAFNASKKTAKDQEQLLASRTAAERALNVAQDANKKGGDAHAKSLARNASAMEVNAGAALDLAKAYLIGGDAAIRAEAMRKGATDATKKGIDVEAQVRRQLDIMIGDQVANSAKSVAQLRDENAARTSVLAQVAAGTLTTGQMNQALSDEAALRPLLKLRMLAQGEQLSVLNTVIAAYRQELDAAHVSEGQFGLDRALSKSIEKVEELKAAVRDLAKTPLNRALDAAQRDAEREAGDQNLPEGAGRKKFVDSRVNEAQAQFQLDQARYVDDTLRGQRDSISMSERELGLIGANDDLRAVEIDKLRLILDLRQRGIDPLSQEGQILLANQSKLSLLGVSIAKSQAAMGELRDFGSSALDTLFSTNSADTWGDRMKSIVGDVKNELLKLVLLNPLKNLINGDSKLPTLTSAIGSIGKLFGRNATGTEYWGGGISLVGENGPELVSMARGSRVTPAAETRRMLAGNDNRPAPVNHFHLDGAVVTQDLVDQMNAIGAGAAVRGAAGGAAMGMAENKASAARKLGRRW